MISFLITLKRLIEGLWHAFKSKNFQALFVLIIFMLLSGTIFYVKEEGLSILDALYFCVVTLSTVGHPSFEPQSSIGKVFTMIYIVAGTGLFLALVAHVAYAIFQANDREDKNDA